MSANSGIEVSQRIRRNFSSKVYPITMLAHGLSGHWMLSGFFLRLLLERTLPCDSLICTSRGSCQAARKILEWVMEQFNREYGTDIRYEGRLDLIPLCVNTTELRPREKGYIRAKLNLPRDAFIILFLGRLSVLKADLFPFLHVLKSLVGANPKRKLLWVVAGTEDKGYAEALHQHARAIGVGEQMKVMLNIPSNTRQLLLPASDAFVSPADSVQESFGISPIEAMACGVPQVVADWDGYRDTVRHGETGFLIPTYWSSCADDLAHTGVVAGWMYDHVCLGQSVAVDVEKTREYLQYLIDNEELRNEMARRSRERALSLYSYEVVVRRYEELWTELTEIARTVQFKRDGINFDQPKYYEFFGHYATKELCEDARLVITPLGKETAVLDRYLPRSVSGLKIFDEHILKLALMKLVGQKEIDREHGSSATCRQVRMGDLLQSLGEVTTQHPDYVRRHIMWLIKSGCVQPLIES